VIGFARTLACAIAYLVLAAVGAEASATESVSPPPGPRPIVVSVGFYLLNLVSVDERSETFDADLYIHCRWRDPRLAFEPEEVGHDRRIYQGDSAGARLAEIWWPDLEFVNTASPQITNRTLSVQPDGTVDYRLGISSNFRAKLDLRRFPFDHQVLEVRIQSFEAGRDLVVLQENPNEMGFDEEDDFSGLTITGITARERTSTIASWGESFSELAFEITVVRTPGFYIWTIFVPLTLVLLLSCTIFFVPIEGFHDRISIALACFLACIATQFAMSFNLPKISYLTPIDRLFLVTYACMALGVAVSVFETAWIRDRPALLRRTDRVASWAIPVLYMVLVAWVALP
jgi:hypothetical protein